MRLLVVLVLSIIVTGCAAQVDSLRFAAEHRSAFAWKAESEVIQAPGHDAIQFVVLGGAQDRLRGAPDRTSQVVARTARRICGDSCDFTVVTGNAVGPAGLRTEEDRSIFKRLVALYGWAGAQFHVMGPRSWGGTPTTTLAQRVLRTLASWRQTHGTRGHAHFWRTALSSAAGAIGHLWGLDTTYLKQRCGQSATPGPGAERDECRSLERLANVAGADGWRIMVGHHQPSGQHGDRSLEAEAAAADLYVFGDGPGQGFSTQTGRLHIGSGRGFARVSVSAKAMAVEIFDVAADGSARRVSYAHKTSRSEPWRVR